MMRVDLECHALVSLTPLPSSNPVATAMSVKCLIKCLAHSCSLDGPLFLGGDGLEGQDCCFKKKFFFLEYDCFTMLC